ncbi:hypothetical protein BH10PSE9_BH10PSE9_16570 [soil metagenome]
MHPLSRLFAVPLIAMTVTACAGGFGGFDFGFGSFSAKPETAMAAATKGTVDVGAAVRLINEYRASRGLGPLSIDDKLMNIATTHAHLMASMDKMAHVLPGEGSFQQRIAAGGFQASMAAENVAAGQDSLQDVFDAWRRSPGHNANMLLSGISKMGIALAIQPGGRYHTYWALVLGEPAKPRAGGPYGGGPAVMFGGGAAR